jgi:hypothetical protein
MCHILWWWDSKSNMDNPPDHPCQDTVKKEMLYCFITVAKTAAFASFPSPFQQIIFCQRYSFAQIP